MALAGLAERKTELLEYKDESTGQIFEAFVARDASKTGRLPLVLIFPSNAGRTEGEDKNACLLADMGYVGFSADVYGKGIRGTTQEEKRNLMKPFVDDRDGYLFNRAKLIWETARKLPYVDPNKVAAIGYCFGGRCVLDMARKMVDPALKGVVSIHGGLGKSEKDTSTEKINAKVLALHGYADPHIPPDQVLAFGKEMTERGADWQLHAYGHAMHGFTHPEANDPSRGIMYDANADRRSWEATRYFLKECFAQK